MFDVVFHIRHELLISLNVCYRFSKILFALVVVC